MRLAGTPKVTFVGGSRLLVPTQAGESSATWTINNPSGSGIKSFIFLSRVYVNRECRIRFGFVGTPSGAVIPSFSPDDPNVEQAASRVIAQVGEMSGISFIKQEARASPADHFEYKQTIFTLRPGEQASINVLADTPGPLEASVSIFWDEVVAE